MSKRKSSKIYNLVLIAVLVLFIIPQTRKPIQVFINKAIVAFVKPSEIDISERKLVSSFDWELREMSGKVIDFNSAKGKVIIINFWATWCPPCVAEMPSLQELYEHYKDNDQIVFLFVSNEKNDVIQKFMNKHNYTFEVYQSLTPYPSEFNVSSIPRTFVISATGEIVIDKTGSADWNSEPVITTIDDLLKVF